jgi:transposase
MSRYPTHERRLAVWYVGMDVHMRQTTFCVLDEDGRKIKTRTVRSGWRTVISELKKLDHPFAVCYEASTGYGGDALRRDLLLERVRHQDVLIKRVEKWLGKTARGNLAVRLLMTIPGVGIRTAEAIVAWVDKPKRFRRNKSYGCYFGVVPCENTSAGRDRLGHITKQGPSFIRQLLVEAAWQGRRRSPVIRAYFDRVKRDDPGRNKIAIVATAHYMLRVMGSMLTTGELWRGEAA